MKRFVLAVLALCALASATTVTPLTIEQLTERSSHVVLARALGVRSEWNPQRTLIYTTTHFARLRTLKGSPAAEFDVRQIGGSAGGYTQKAAGVRHWQVGEEALLFLRPSDSPDGALAVTGLMQGNFAVTHALTGETFVSNGVPGVTAYRAGGSALTHYAGTRISLDEVAHRVVSAGR